MLGFLSDSYWAGVGALAAALSLVLALWQIKRSKKTTPSVGIEKVL